MSVVPPLTAIAELKATVQLRPKVIVPCASTAVASWVSVGQDVKVFVADPAAAAGAPHNQKAPSAVETATGVIHRSARRQVSPVLTNRFMGRCPFPLGVG
jgi:hypothetical protein